MTAPPKTVTHAVPPRRLSWLRAELDEWTSAGIISDAQSLQISSRYREGASAPSHFSIGGVLLTLGGVFVGIGLIWLVAANLDELSPSLRLATVLVLWLAFLLGSEVLSSRSASPSLIGALRLLAALGFGAVIFQAAQSLQVPAYEPRLVGAWAAGALLHGYLTRAVTPFLVGVGTGVTWWLWQPMWAEPSALGMVLLLGAGAVLAASLAVLHDGRMDRFAWVWRLVAGGFALTAMFVAAVPDVGSDDIVWSFWLITALVVAGAFAAVAALRTSGLKALEPAAAIAVLVIATLLATWQTGTDTSDIDVADWLHAAISVLAYVLLAVALVALGTLREHAALTWTATAALIVFTTFQSFAVFAPIVTGAWLFVVLGTIFLGTGYLVDRARRELVQVLDRDPEGTLR